MCGNVLIVEDDPNVATLLGLIVQRNGYRPRIVGNGFDALEALSTQSFQLVLMDFKLPYMNGVEATRRIRLDHGNTRIPILMITGSLQMADRKAMLDAGACAVIEKPFHVKDLVAIIHEKMNH